jgi:hypothetical protein
MLNILAAVTRGANYFVKQLVDQQKCKHWKKVPSNRSKLDFENKTTLIWNFASYLISKENKRLTMPPREKPVSSCQNWHSEKLQQTRS